MFRDASVESSDTSLMRCWRCRPSAHHCSYTPGAEQHSVLCVTGCISNTRGVGITHSASPLFTLMFISPALPELEGKGNRVFWREKGIACFSYSCGVSAVGYWMFAVFCSTCLHGTPTLECLPPSAAAAELVQLSEAWATFVQCESFHPSENSSVEKRTK